MPGEAAIVFTEYRDTLRHLAAAMPEALQMHGGMTAAERAGVQQRFNEEGGWLIATDAASEGLNLQQRCRLVVNYELPWNPARLEQRIGRVDRIGQRRSVHAVSLVAPRHRRGSRRREPDTAPHADSGRARRPRSPRRVPRRCTGREERHRRGAAGRRTDGRSRSVGRGLVVRGPSSVVRGPSPYGRPISGATRRWPRSRSGAASRRSPGRRGRSFHLCARPVAWLPAG